MSGTMMDITRPKQAEETGRKSEPEYRELLDLLPVAVYVCEKSGIITYYNKLAAQLWGREPKCGDSDERFSGALRVYRSDGTFMPHHETFMAEVLHNGVSVQDQEVIIERPDESGVNVLLNIVPIKNSAGELTGAINCFREITERQRAEETHARLAAIVESSDDAIIGKTLDGMITSWNSGAERIFGYSAAEVVGQPISILVPPDRPDELPRILEAVRRGQRVEHFETERVRKDGRRIHISLTVSPTKDSAGRVIGASKIARDITEHKRAEKAQRFLAEASNILVSSLGFETTLNNFVRLVVPTFADWCAISVVEEDETRVQLAAVHGDPTTVELLREIRSRYQLDLNNLEQPQTKVLKTGQSELMAEVPDSLLVALAHDADHLDLLRKLSLKSFMVVPLVAHGRRLGTITFARAESTRRYDPSDLAVAEELARRGALAVDNARLFRQAQEANRIKDEFLATVSHELRTPLSAMLGWTELLRSGELDEATSARALEVIERNAKVQAQLIEDLLDVSRIIMGKLRLDICLLEPVSVIEAAIDAVRPAAEAKGVRLQAALDPEAGLVLGDQDRLQQVVWNLLFNAVKFTPRGGRIQVQLKLADSYVEIAVNDTGQGIKPEFLPYVFDRFRQADGSHTRRHRGLGLGLAIVRHLVELHGGIVDVTSAGEGQGATFIVRLPSVVQYTKDLEIEPAAQRSTTTQASVLSDRSDLLEGVRVLVVDDEPDARELLITVLNQNGAKVMAAASVADAINALEAFKPDVLVSDIEMPAEDGYSLINQVRALEAHRGGQIPAAALTAHVRAEDRRRALSAGYQRHIAKPVRPAELVAVVADLATRTRRSGHGS
jgi:PAS domain S-box-containing protein